jgi:small subunit ribosomal protein S4e
VSISGDYDFETIEDYVVVIGEKEPAIKLGGEVVE